MAISLAEVCQLVNDLTRHAQDAEGKIQALVREVQRLEGRVRELEDENQQLTAALEGFV